MGINPNDWTRNDTTARIALPATTTRAPGRRSHWTAEAGTSGVTGGYFRAEGSTERAALANLSGIVADFLAAYQKPEVFTYGGYVSVLSVAPPCEPGSEPSWTVQTVRRDGHVSYSDASRDTVQEARASVRRNLAHLATDWHDDDSVHAGAAYLDTHGIESVGYGQYGPTDFYRYAAWQRAAKAAIDAGEPDFHAWATDHAREFEVPRPQ